MFIGARDRGEDYTVAPVKILDRTPYGYIIDRTVLNPAPKCEHCGLHMRRDGGVWTCGH